jgi:hypothetical protein
VPVYGARIHSLAADATNVSAMRLHAEDDYHELPGTYLIGQPRPRRSARTAVAGIIVFVALIVAAVAGAVWAGKALHARAMVYDSPSGGLAPED